MKLDHKMDMGFERVDRKIDTEITKLRIEMKEGFLKVEHRFERNETRIENLEQERKLKSE